MSVPEVAQQGGNTIDNRELQRLKVIDQTIDKHESSALRARWEFGHRILAARDGKGRLPNGYMTRLVESTGKSRVELGRRVRFAERFPSEDQLCHAVTQFGSWHEVVRNLGGGSGGGVGVKPSKERLSAQRFRGHAETMLSAVVEGFAPGDVDAIREDLIAARACIDKALPYLDCIGKQASKRRHPAGKVAQKAAVA